MILALSISWDFTGPKWSRKEFAIKDAAVELLTKNVLAQKLLLKEIVEATTKKIASVEMRRIKTARKKAAEEDACRVFGRNLRALLLQNPKRADKILDQGSIWKMF